MKKLCEIKTGEKFEYDGQFYMGMESADPDFEGVVHAINLKTGKTDLGFGHAHLMVRPLNGVWTLCETHDVKQPEESKKINTVPGDLFGNKDLNCTYTGSDGNKTKMSIHALLEFCNELPELPTIMRMDIDVKRGSFMPENWITLSSSVADALEDLFKK